MPNPDLQTFAVNATSRCLLENLVPKKKPVKFPFISLARRIEKASPIRPYRIIITDKLSNAITNKKIIQDKHYYLNRKTYNSPRIQ